MKTNAFALAIAVALFLAILVGCDDPKSPKPDDKKILQIAVIPMGTTHEYWKSIHAGAVKAEYELQGVQIHWEGPVKESDREQQINIVDDFVIQHIDGIVLAPLDDQALVKPVREATQAGIPVVLMDAALNGEAGKDFVSFVATNSYEGGQLGGKRLGELLKGKGNVLMLRYMAGSVSTAQREQGFLDAMRDDFPEITLVSTDQRAEATGESAQRVADSLLQKFPDLDGVFCPNESTTFGMLRALQESGRAGKVKFVGYDSTAKLIQAMTDHELHGLVLQDPLDIGYTAVKTIVAKMRGDEVKPRIYTGCILATPENMNEPKVQALLSPPIDHYLKRKS